MKPLDELHASTEVRSKTGQAFQDFLPGKDVRELSHWEPERLQAGLHLEQLHGWYIQCDSIPHNPFLCLSLHAFVVHIRQSASWAWAAGLDREGVPEGDANGLQGCLEKGRHDLK